MEEVVKQTTTVVEPVTAGEVVTTTKKVVPPVKVEHPQVTFEKKKTIFRAYQYVWFFIGFIEVLLAFRFILKVIGANPLSGFTSLIYTLSAPFAFPFLGIVKQGVFGNSVWEWSTLIAAGVYVVIGWGIVKFLLLIKPVTPEEVAVNVDGV